MNKFLKTALCAGLCGTMLFATACNNKGGGGSSVEYNNPETRALALSISAPDGNFNPFFYTSAPDGQVINMTQASLITADTDASGKVYAAAGEEYPTVAKDFRVIFRNANGVEVDSTQAAKDGTTEYEFLIKKGMKFSDGTELTIKDVLFNFYVYLDTAYTGSNTMYSVDIQGLKAYQNNDANLADDANTDDEIVALAQMRMQKLIDFSENSTENPLDSEGKEDLEKIRELYSEELESDWTSIETSWAETFKDNYTFTAAWQAYLYQEGIVESQYKYFKIDGVDVLYEIRKDENGNIIDPSNRVAYDAGKVVTTLDPWEETAYPSPENPGFVDAKIQQVIVDYKAATSAEEIEQYIRDNGGDEDNALRELTKKFCIETVYDQYFTLDTQVGEILMFWATGDTAYTYFVASEREKKLTQSLNPMYYIKGIQTDKVTTFSSSVGNSDYSYGATYNLDGEYDVLRIVVNKVDPAAIWQFGISVAPMHYYSGTYENVNYITRATAADNNGIATDADQFGVKRGDTKFFEKVIKANSGVPVGAGPYIASTTNGGKATKKSEFLSNNIVYFERNTNFHTMGAEINDAKIKYLRYKVIDDDRIINSVIQGAIDYGEPSASTTNQTTVNKNLGVLGQESYDTNGYGYVGINPTYVPDHLVRQMIMSAMNTSLAKKYYGDLGKVLYRPMSRTSWAYPTDATTYYPSMDSATIKSTLMANGYSMKNGILTNDKTGHQLKYTFTIAGGTTDHPAYQMFQEAMKTLNQAGFQISVSTDQTALIKLAKGQLTVWAAAWSTGVDPDMYQVYHKDSNATSVLNWGYRTILNDTNNIYDYEKGLVNDISDKIEEGRKYLAESRRKEIYAECLDMVMDLAVELPIYQRSDLCIYNKNIIDPSTLNAKPNSTIGLIDRIWNVNYYVK